ncbi:hypothetical protein E2542_SST23021 [Spatholobus suberectus]|nr:hypothetical protein E2542_SST23021 [Spatholobus suberectus]
MLYTFREDDEFYGNPIGTFVVGVRFCEVMEIIEEDGDALGLNRISERISNLGGFAGSNGEEDCGLMTELRM